MQTRKTTGAAVWRLLQSRPTAFLATVREQALFKCTRVLSAIIRVPGVQLGQSVRLQKFRSVLAERPNAAIAIGDYSIIYEDVRLEAYGHGAIQIGAGSILGGGRWVSRYGIQTGNRLLTSWNLFVQDFDPHPTDRLLRRAQVERMTGIPESGGTREREISNDVDHAIETKKRKKNNFEWNYPGKPIKIGDDVWIGANVTILKGAVIGDGCIVASGSVVLQGEYPPDCVIAGNPARVVKRLAVSSGDTANACETEYSGEPEYSGELVHSDEGLTSKPSDSVGQYFAGSDKCSVKV